MMAFAGTAINAQEAKPPKMVYATIDGKKGYARISADDLLDVGKLEASDKKLKIISYDVTYTKPRIEDGREENMFIVLETATSPEFSKELRGVIKHELKPGGKVYFENVKVEKANGKIMKIEGIEVIIE